MNLNDAGRLVAVIDNRIRRLIKSEAQVETTWGEVCGISADGMLASAYLFGSSDPSEGFRIPGSLALAVGDKVKVAWDGRGDRYVVEAANPGAFKKVAINASTGEVAVGDGTSEPTPLPTDADVAAVQAEVDAVETDLATHESDPDGHHPESHAHDGVDGSGILSHANLSNVLQDDHHNRAHTHGDGGDGTTLTPGILELPGGVPISVGSAFPGTPVDGEMLYHTTRGTWFIYTASISRWLTPPILLPVVAQQNAGFGGDQTGVARVGSPAKLFDCDEVFVREFYGSTIQGAAGSGSQYWNIKLVTSSSTGTRTVIATINTQGNATGNRWYVPDPISIDTLYSIDDARNFEIDVDAVTGNPGTLYIAMGLLVSVAA